MLLFSMFADSSHPCFGFPPCAVRCMLLGGISTKFAVLCLCVCVGGGGGGGTCMRACMREWIMVPRHFCTLESTGKA